MDFDAWNIIWSLLFGFLAVLIVVGNALTIYIFLKQRLRKRAHYLLISLAVADLLVGLLTVPLYIAANASPVLIRLGNSADIFTGLTSIFTLAVISLERMCAIGWPFRHRALSLSAYKFAIVTPWMLAAIVTAIQVLRYTEVIGRDGSVIVVIASPAAPLFVMCTAYCVIWWKEKSRTDHQNQQMKRERELAKTLFLITGASLLTWLPFQILMILVLYFRFSKLMIKTVMYIIKLLQFSNSLVNVIIYPFRISEFRVALLNILQCCVNVLRAIHSSCCQKNNTSGAANESIPIREIGFPQANDRKIVNDRPTDQTEGRKNERTDGRSDGRTDGRTNQTDVRTDGRKPERKD